MRFTVQTKECPRRDAAGFLTAAGSPFRDLPFLETYNGKGCAKVTRESFESRRSKQDRPVRVLAALPTLQVLLDY